MELDHASGYPRDDAIRATMNAATSGVLRSYVEDFGGSLEGRAELPPCRPRRAHGRGDVAVRVAQIGEVAR